MGNRIKNIEYKGLTIPNNAIESLTMGNRIKNIEYKSLTLPNSAIES